MHKSNLIPPRISDFDPHFKGSNHFYSATIYFNVQQRCYDLATEKCICDARVPRLQNENWSKTFRTMATFTFYLKSLYLTFTSFQIFKFTKNFMMSSIPVIYLLPNYNFQAISTKLIHFDVSINLLRSIYFPDPSLSRLNKFYHLSAICL